MWYIFLYALFRKIYLKIKKILSKIFRIVGTMIIIIYNILPNSCVLNIFICCNTFVMKKILLKFVNYLIKKRIVIIFNYYKSKIYIWTCLKLIQCVSILNNFHRHISSQVYNCFWTYIVMVVTIYCRNVIKSLL